MTHLFTTKWISLIPTHGVLLAPGVTADDGWRLNIGDALELRRPDGTVLHTSIAGFYHFSRRSKDEPPTLDLLLPKHICKNDVPPGTEVWLREKRGTEQERSERGENRDEEEKGDGRKRGT
jgi:hypothetical protein